MSPFKHILVPVDFGAATTSAVDLALTMARRFESQVTLFYAFDVTPFVSMSPFAPALDVEPILASFEREMKELVQKTCPQWPRLDSYVCRGNPSEAIVAAAGERGCDLIVIGTHGRRGVARAFLGSVAERVVRMSPIPVLTVHPGDKGTAVAA